jgi:murein L,D-transpeptidase YcbB/YkuD
MAEWLLRNDHNWNTSKIVSAMNQTHETLVKLKDAIPVFIIYYTAWVDENGLLNFRDDVYEHDKEVIQKMFVPARPTDVVRVDNMNVTFQ